MTARRVLVALVTLALLATLAAGGARAQPVPRIEELPASMPEGKRAPLEIVRTRLAAMRDDLRQQITAHNARCGSVDTASPAGRACQDAHARFVGEKARYVRAVDAFNDIVRAYGGEPLGVDVDKWKRAIADGKLRAAIDAALAAATRRGELGDAEAAAIGTWIGAAMVISDDDRWHLAQRVIVVREPGQPPVVDTYKFVELNDGETAASVARELVSVIGKDRVILGRMK